MKTISIIHPSRGRAYQAKETADRWIAKSSGTVPIEYILSIDTSDPQKADYLALFEKAIITLADNTCVVEAANAGARNADGDIFVLVSDDFDCFVDWDLKLVEAFTGNECRVLKTYDGTQKWIVTLPIMDKAYYNMQGYLYCPEYKHMFADTDQTHKAEIEGRLLFRNDLVFTHNHYSTGANKKDEVNVKADATWAQGEEVYLRRVREGFGYNDVDVFKVSDLGKHHINWLKKKLNQ